MKFNDWTLEDLIKYLECLKASEYLDYRCVPRCFGEIFFYNGEDKAGSMEQEGNKKRGAAARLLS